MAYENGTTMSDIEIAEAFLLSGILVKFCDAIGAKAGTAEYVRKSVTQLRAENARLTNRIAEMEAELSEAISGRKDAISQAIMDWNISDPPFPYLNEFAITELISSATDAVDWAYAPVSKKR